MSAARLPRNELSRLESLHAYRVLDTEPDPRFDIFTRLAQHIFKVPISLVSLIDEDRQWFKSRIGLSAPQTPRHASFCAHAILNPDQVLAIEDASQDARFAANELVTGEPNIRFYAGAPLMSSDGQPLGTICVIDDRPRRISPSEVSALRDLAAGVMSALELHRKVLELRHTALHDPLTGLPNRAYFQQAVATRLASTLLTAEDTVLLCLDLDRLKTVNDLYGHAGGDALLREAARRLDEAIPAPGMVARLGGDEFAVLVPPAVQPHEASLYAQGLIDVLAKPFSIDGHPVPIRASVGNAVSPGDGRTADHLIRAADTALYQAKRDGRGVVRSFAPAMHRARESERSLERDLRAAVAQRQFGLAWQPYADARTGRLLGYEALLRWDRPGHGPVSPAEFIPIAETCGIVQPIDIWMLDTACRAAAAWGNSLRLAINVSSEWFRSDSLARIIAETLVRRGFPAARLEIEITERTLIDNHRSARNEISQIKALGVQTVLDDFGVGYSSLHYLEAFPFDKVKLDGTFIGGVGRNRRSEAVVRAMMQLGPSLGLTVCGEGVETEDQLGFLQALGCDQVQGNLIGAAKPFTDAPEHLFDPYIEPIRLASD